jgi:hypothetical protein
MVLRLLVLLCGAAWFALSAVAGAEEVAPKVIVFVPPEDVEAPLRDALTAQLSGVAAELVVEHFVSAEHTLKQHVDESRSLAAAHQAIGVFWLDTQSTGEWLVFLALPAENRVMMRRVPIGPDGSAAAMEVVAVITRESTSALLAGRQTGMTEIVVPGEPAVLEPMPKPAPPPKQVPAPTTPHEFGPIHGVSIASSYYGDLYSNTSGWQSGIAIAGDYSFTNGLRFAANFVFFQQLDSENDGLSLLVRRYPVGVEASYSYRRPNWFLTLGFRGIAEITSRHVVAVAPPAKATSDTTRSVVFLSPRLRFDYRVTEASTVFLAAGVDFALNGFSFVNRVDGVDRAVFEPLRYRPSAEVGVAFWP